MSEETTHQAVHKALQPLAKHVHETLIAETGDTQAFLLVVFTGMAPQFISNAMQDDVMKAMDDMVQQWKRGLAVNLTLPEPGAQ